MRLARLMKVKVFNRFTMALSSYSLIGYPYMNNGQWVPTRGHLYNIYAGVVASLEGAF